MPASSTDPTDAGAPPGDGLTGQIAAGGVADPDDPTDPDLPDNRAGGTDVLAGQGAPASGRGGLDRHRIVSAAVAYIDEQGLPALTMRKLGAALGVEAMALYRYVPSREDLLDGVVEIVVDELFADPDVYIAPRHGWEDYLQRLAHGVRRIALAHPAVFPLVATRPPAAPWVRPPLRSLRWVESFLSALTTHGFTHEQAVLAYRAYSSFLLGHLLLEVAQRGVAINAIDDPDGAADVSAGELAPYPLVVELEPLLTQDESVTEFEESLESLLARLGELQAPGSNRSRRRPPSTP
ncbi:MAG: Transcriptional regulator, TetR family [Klenkia sp.]|nr:Transcriptional regulator, TetR family [Klenkia sp.]